MKANALPMQGEAVASASPASHSQTPSTRDDDDGDKGSGEYTSSYEYEYEESAEGEETTDDEESHSGSDEPGEDQQESLLSFATFTLPYELDGHRIMTLQAFQRTLLIGTNQGSVAVMRIPPAKPRAAARASGQGEGAGRATAGGSPRRSGDDGASSSSPSPSPRQPPGRQPKLVHLLQNHADPISDVGCNAGETFIAASDKAGCISVQSLADLKDVWRRQMEVPIQSVAMHPAYDVEEDRPLVCVGADKVFLVTKLMFLSHRRTTLLAERNGKVVCVRWSLSGAFVAWLTERGLTFYSHYDKKVLRTIPSPVVSTSLPQSLTLAQKQQQQQQLARRLELYPPTLFWETAAAANSSSSSNSRSAEVLVCGWGDWVQQIGIREVPPRPTLVNAGAVSAVQARSYRMESFTQAAMQPSSTENPYRVCGIRPFGTNRYLVLACVVDGNAAEGAMRDLEVRVVHRFTLEDLYRGRMLVAYAHPLQLALACHHGTQRVSDGVQRGPRPASASGGPQPHVPRSALYPPPDTIYYVLSVDSVVQATPCDEDDHVDYLLRTRRFEEAYHYALTHQLHRHDTAQLARRMLTGFLEDGDADRVVALLPECIGAGDCAEWERWIFVLDQRGESYKLVDALPTRHGAQGEAAAGHRISQGSSTQWQQQQSTIHATAVPAKGTVMPASAWIGKEYYDLVLLRALERDAALFNTAVRRFEGLFNLDVVAKAAEMKYHECNGIMLAAPLDPHAPSRRAEDRSVDEAAAAEGRGDQRELQEGPQQLTGRAEERQLKALSEAYGGLLRLLGRNEDALQVLLKVKDSEELFLFIRQTGLFQKALELLPELFSRSRRRTIALLLEHAPPPMNAPSPSPSPPPPPGPASSSTALRNGGAAARATATTELMPFVPGADNDPLAPEAVVRRLELTDRECLWAYLTALRAHNKPAFTDVAKRKAQLVATLFIEYDRAQLLPFLKEMSMYLDRIKEVYALCRKHGLMEEVVFLMARMGKEEEGLKVLVQNVKNMQKAVKYVNEVPIREDQAALFRKLVQLAVETNAQLPVSAVDGQRYVSHDTEIGDTFASIAARYGVDEDLIREANSDGHRLSSGGHAASTSTPPGTPGSGGSSSFTTTAAAVGGADNSTTSAPSSAAKPSRRHMLRHYAAPVSPLLLKGGGAPGSASSSATRRLRRSSSRGSDPALASHSSSSEKDFQRSPSQHQHQQKQPHRPPPRPCVVPLNLLSALLSAAADPAYADNPAIDATHLITALPDGEPIPRVGAYIAAVTRSRADEVAFLSTIMQAAERDLARDYTGLLHRRTAAIRIDPTARTRNGAAAGLHNGGLEGRGVPSHGTHSLAPSAVAAGSSVKGGGGGVARASSIGGGAYPQQHPMSCGLCGQRVPLPLAKAPSPAHALTTITTETGETSRAKGTTAAPQSVPEEEVIGGLVAFACQHVFHPRCVLTYLAAEGLLSEGDGGHAVRLSAFLEHPETFLHLRHPQRSRMGGVGGRSGGEVSRRKVLPHCRVCEVGGAAGGVIPGAM